MGGEPAWHAAVIDLVYELIGDGLPKDYPLPLWRALESALPELTGHPAAGVLPLKAADGGDVWLLPRRARLVLRLPTDLEETGRRLCGQTLDVSGCLVRVGDCQRREIAAFPTLHAHHVAGSPDEVEFLADVAQELGRLGVTAQVLCGRAQRLDLGDQVVQGFDLVLHDLKPEASLLLQRQGLGDFRRFGCGLFVPHKTITRLT
jgi:CRISPR-associated protein Cas6